MQEKVTLQEKRGEESNLLALELFWQNRVKILRSLFGNIYNKMSQIMPSSRDQSKRSITKQMSPALASQLEGLWKESQSYTNGFQEPEMQQITKVGILESCLRFIFLFHSRRVYSHSRGTLKTLVTTICRPTTPWSSRQRSSRSGRYNEKCNRRDAELLIIVSSAGPSSWEEVTK